MNLMLLLSPLMLSLIAIVAIFACVLFVLDTRRTSHQNHLRRLMRLFVSEHAAQTFSVIVPANTTAHSFRSLIDNLEQQHYSKLQVIAVVGPTAGSKLMNELRRMQRQKKNTVRMRIIRQGSQTEKSLIRRYADGEVLLWLNTDDRLSDDFFTRMSIELLDESCQALSPRTALKPDDSLRTASQALNIVARQSISTLMGRRVATPRVVRRTAYLESDALQSSSIEHSTILVKELPNYRANILIETGVLAAVLVVTVASVILLPYGWQIVASTFGGMIVLLMILRLLTYPYSALTKLTLCLMIPLWPLTAVVLGAGNILLRAIGRLIRLRTNPAR